MNLDDHARFPRLDPQDMLSQIRELPDQLERAWDLGARHDLPTMEGIRQIVIAGMGGSAIGADLLKAYAAPIARVPLVVWRNYDLPGFARGPETLVIVSSHSGNTEETLSAYERGIEAGAQLIAVTTGGALASRAEETGALLWTFEHEGQPRAAVGYLFGLLLSILSRLYLIPDPEEDVRATVAAMQLQQGDLAADVPVVENPAKRMAGQLIERWPSVIGADLLAPVARRWRTQISEIAKAVAQFEELPEADHNLVAGVEHPEPLLGRTMVVFLRSAHNHPRNLRRLEVTREILMVSGFNTDVIEASGEGRLAQQWTCLHLGDYISYYLAMAYGADPTPVMAIEELKARMRQT